MGYFTRVFCSNTSYPKISDILQKLKLDGFHTTTNLQESELNNLNWTNFELTYDVDRLPLLIEINKKGKSNELVEEEIKEFLNSIGPPKFYELKKKRVINHLKSTEYIICIQLPTSDITNKGYDVNGLLMKHIECDFSGIIQVDGEGF